MQLKDCAFCDMMADDGHTDNEEEIRDMQTHFRRHHHIEMKPMLSVRALK